MGAPVSVGAIVADPDASHRRRSRDDGVRRPVARNIFGLRERLGSLLAAGTGICGVSAVVAVAKSIDADEESITYAAGTVLLFDAVTLVVYPAIGTCCRSQTACSASGPD